MSDRLPPAPRPAPPASAPLAAPIPSERLFAGATEVVIEHRGALYRLKQTALGKLILTK
jgi:hemin uptake protein HemP